MEKKYQYLVFLYSALILIALQTASIAEEVNMVVCSTSVENPRNTEADLIALKDGRLFLAYSRFRGSTDDNASADIYGIYSSDRGKSWSKPQCIFPNTAVMNLMSVSLLRLRNGKIMIGYLRKNAEYDCRMVVRISEDETKTWGPEIPVTKPQIYYVVNNNRIIQLSSGRLLIPASNHGDYREGKASFAEIYYSDDDGKTWVLAPGKVNLPGIGVQEPGVVELMNRSVYMILRNSLGSIHAAISQDGGLTWGEPFSTGLVSPVAPASINRIPQTGDLLMIYNNNPKQRLPLTAALSNDEGKTWRVARDLEDKGSHYAYTSITFIENEAFLTYYSVEKEKQTGIDTCVLKLRILPSTWFYGK